MSYTPTTEEIRNAATEWLWSPEDFDAWLAAHDAEVAARSIKTWVNRVRSELDATRAEGINLGRDYLQGLYSALQQAADHAARIENDLAEQGAEESEWEYARMNRLGNVAEPDDDLADALLRAERSVWTGGYNRVVRRRRAGEWMPVEQEDDDADH